MEIINDKSNNNNFPLEMKDVEPHTAEILMKYFTGKYYFLYLFVYL